jgi:hypothetical protein
VKGSGVIYLPISGMLSVAVCELYTLFVLRGKSPDEAAMAALLVLVTVIVSGIAQSLPQCRDEGNKTVDW